MSSYLQAVLIAKAAQRILSASEDLMDALFNPIDPQVAPEGSSPFTDEATSKIEAYKDHALAASDFESFSDLTARVATELQLDLQTDLPRIAQILNRVRQESGLAPL